MNKLIPTGLLAATLLLTIHSSFSETNTTEETTTISLQGALAFGPSQMKMHALYKISKSSMKGRVDESFLPGFRACSDDPSSAVRSLAATMVGRYYITGQSEPNPEAINILKKLSLDTSPDVRYSALHNGLTEVQNKPDDLVHELVDAAAVNREEGLYDKIIASLFENKSTASEYINLKLKAGTSIAYYEIYKDLMQEKPAHSEKYRDMPSSQPQLFVFTCKKKDKSASAKTLKTWAGDLGIESLHVEVSGYANQRVLLLTTYITKDNESVLENLSALPEHIDFMSKFWLTPKLETEIELVRKRDNK